MALDLAGAAAGAVFAASALGIIPTAALMGRATEELAARSGPGIGGLLNVTFGNAPELIIALFALGKGLPLPGAELVDYGSTAEHLSLLVAIVLIFTYVAGLFFSLKTHRELFNPEYGDEDSWGWSVRKSVLVLAGAGILVGIMSEVLVGSIEETSHAVGLSEFFIGVIVVAIVGNAAEHWVAVLVAMKNKMDLSVNIAIGSSAQVALFVAPVLVLASFFIGPHPLALVFNGFELGAILIAILIANYVTQDGESTWFEGVQLLAVYAVFGIAFYYA